MRNLAETIARYLTRHTGYTRRTYYAHLRSIYQWLGETQGVPSPMDSVPVPARPRPRPRPLSRADAVLSLDSATGDLRSQLMLGRYAGLRAHEVAKICGEDIDAECLFVHGKGGQDAIIPTHPALWTLAQSYPRHGWWFPSERTTTGHMTAHAVTNRISRHFHALGIEGSSHRNRHLYGTELLRGGANVRTVQELMRHSSIEMTMRYLGVDEQEKVAAIRSLVA